MKGIQRSTERLNNEIFIKRSIEVHGNKYDYSKVNYINTKTNVIIICPIHGEFLKRPDKHIHLKQGCPKCNNCYHPSTEEWIKRAQEKFGNRFDYSEVIYKSNKDKITIICPEHGKFEITPKEHINSTFGCPKCFNSTKTNKNNFINLFIKKHGERFDYTKSIYNGLHKDITIICKEHGEFTTTPNKHLKHDSGGCPKCNPNYSPTTNEWIEKCKIYHGNKYDYSKSSYINAENYTTIICPEHGEFEINARQHARGQGCPKCGHIISKQEIEIYEYIKNILGTEIEIVCNNREILNGKEIDIFIPSKNIGIEYNGLYWHSDVIRNDKKHLLNKTNLCENNNIRLIHIYADEWLYKKEICKSRLRNILGYTENTLYARKCVIKSITYKEISAFLNANHIQGTVISKYNYGLFYNNELISVMSFGQLRKNLGTIPREGTYELLRFCNKIDFNVVGGASKLLKHFIYNIKPNEIISYADRRWSIGNLYEKLGFEFIRNTDVNYFYIVDGIRKNRFGFRKDVLITKYGCTKNITEHEFCKSKGWYRIYDCGCKLYSLKI